MLLSLVRPKIVKCPALPPPPFRHDPSLFLTRSQVIAARNMKNPSHSKSCCHPMLLPSNPSASVGAHEFRATICSGNVVRPSLSIDISLGNLSRLTFSERIFRTIKNLFVCIQWVFLILTLFTGSMVLNTGVTCTPPLERDVLQPWSCPRRDVLHQWREMRGSSFAAKIWPRCTT